MTWNWFTWPLERKNWNERRSIEQHSLHTFRSSYQLRNSALLNCYINSGKHMPWLTELTLLLSCMTSDCRRRIFVAHPFDTATLTHTQCYSAHIFEGNSHSEISVLSFGNFLFHKAYSLWCFSIAWHVYVEGCWLCCIYIFLSIKKDENETV